MIKDYRTLIFRDSNCFVKAIFPGRSIWLCLFIFYFGIAQAQDFNNYQPARCSGTVPQDFLKLGSEKALEAVAKVKDKDLDKNTTKNEAEYEISANFMVDKMLNSGQILFGDPMSVYLNRIADILLASDPELREALRFYVLRSDVPNAYATHTGVIVVSIGLLARVENEAQIACILAHEIQHYVKKHSLNQFKMAKNLRQSYGNISRAELDVFLSEVYRFSKDAETEADILGFQLLQKTSYNLEDGLSVFEILRYTEYPFLEIQLPLDSFETENYKYPKSLRQDIEKYLKRSDKDAAENADNLDAEDDENSTHPSLSKRIAKLRDLLEEMENRTAGKQFLVGEENFFKAQRMARCELLLLHVRSAKFAKSLYLARVMSTVYGPTLFTDKISAMSWYGITKHRIHEHDLDAYGCNAQDAVGDWRPLMTMFRKMSIKECTALGLREIYVLTERNGGDVWFRSLCDDLFILAQKEGGLRLNDFLDYAPAVSAEVETDSTVKPTEQAAPKVRNPRSRSQDRVDERPGKSVRSEYYYAVFYDIADREKLARYFKEIKYTLPETPTETPAEEDEESVAKRIKRSDLKPVINHLVLFEPGVSQYKITAAGAKRQYFSEEKLEIYISERMKTLSTQTGLELTMVGRSVDKQITVSDINNYMALNDWFLERLYNDTNAMQLWNGQFARPILDSLGTPYLGWTGFQMLNRNRKANAPLLFASMVFYPTFPLYMAWQISKEKKVYYRCIVYNIKSGEMVTAMRKEMSHKIREDYMNAQIYNLLFKIRYNLQ